MVEFQGDIVAAYEDVRNDKTPTNWLLLDYIDDKSDVLFVSATGAGGLDELREHLKPEKASFGYLRMTIGNDELSLRQKFVLISWCGPQVKVMRKAKLAVHIADVKGIIKSFAVEIAGSTSEDLSDKEVKLKVQKAMGANYDRQASQY
ncbi:uncharacterized protein BJ171DRAFT_162676 [Polychytrium aggregatum]|uniref:uncharacterized protein n=1 Tax=Polychytrium aggregatum TaxID=110093 RepID=UPI0022FEFDC6|nr:uncharacterized protein BJ171DRAFT_162676 [Polychytrium aggregatum]KAI9202860.1 hypothetical protein BJ171DRAFT_162676 [Polychytrium aggregatum]